MQGPTPCTDDQRIGDHLGLQSLLLHLIGELSGPHWTRILTCAGKRTVGDEIGLETQLLHPIAELPGPLSQPALLACKVTAQYVMTLAADLAATSH